jgi:hypothetical protein
LRLRKTSKKRLDQNLKIKPQAPVVDMPQVHFDPLGNHINRWRRIPQAITCFAIQY